MADAGSSKAYAIFNYEESLLRNKPWAIGKNSDQYSVFTLPDTETETDTNFHWVMYTFYLCAY